MKNNYIPAPLDTGDIELTPELRDLAEALARNVHEVWAKARYAEGWRYGPVRDDTLRLTPCMTDYDSLPEEERDYDRRTSLETIRFLIAKGFKIEKHS